MIEKIVSNGLLDQTEWQREITADDLDGVETDYDRTAREVMAIEEPAAVRTITYEAFNLFTLAAHDYVAVIDFFVNECEQFVDTNEIRNMGIDEWRRRDIEELVGQRPVLRRQGMNAIARMWWEIERPKFVTPERYYIRPHSRVVRRNYNLFPSLEVGAMWPGEEMVYRGSGKPTRVVPQEDTLNSALGW